MQEGASIAVDTDTVHVGVVLRAQAGPVTMRVAPSVLLAAFAAVGASAADAPKNVLFVAGAPLLSPGLLPAGSAISRSGAAALNPAFLIAHTCHLTPRPDRFAVDDMRPSIGAFNFTMAHTPNMDHLAATGLVFKRAYVQYAFCAPSRNRCSRIQLGPTMPRLAVNSTSPPPS